jgi:flavoprotein
VSATHNFVAFLDDSELAEHQPGVMGEHRYQMRGCRTHAPCGAQCLAVQRDRQQTAGRCMGGGYCREVLPEPAIIEQADRNGQQRVAEMNRTVENNLLTIIDSLSAPGGCCGSEPSCSCRERDNTDAR